MCPYLLQWDSIDIAQDHAAECSAQVVYHPEV